MRNVYLFTTLLIIFSSCIKERHVESPEFQSLSENRKQQVERYIHALQDVTFDALGFTERWRPQYHLTPAFGSLESSVSFFKKDEVWHYFFHSEARKIGVENGWGHAISKDLVHWKLLPMAIYPDEGCKIGSGEVVWDKNNSSGIFDTDGGFVSIYVHKSDSGNTVQIAFSSKGIYWNQYNQDVELDPSIQILDVYWSSHLERWVLLGNTQNQTFVYHSMDLKTWTKKTLLLDGISAEEYFFGEFPVQNTVFRKWVLRDSSRQYIVGTFDGEKFYPEGKLRTNIPLSGQIQAFDPMTKQLIAVRDVASSQTVDLHTHPWKGMLALPISVELKKAGDESYILQCKVVEDIHSLQREQVQVPDWTAGAEWKLLSDEMIIGNLIQLNMTFAPEAGAIFQIEFLKGERESLMLNYDEKNEELSLVKLKDKHEFLLHKAPLSLIDGHVHLQLWLDVSVIELVANNGELIMASEVLLSPRSQTIQVRSRNAACKIIHMNAHQMYSFWKEEFYKIQRTLAQQPSLHMRVGETIPFEAGVFPYYLKADSFKWDIVNENLLHLEKKENGKILLKAMQEGETSLIIDCYKGRADTVSVTVN